MVGIVEDSGKLYRWKVTPVQSVAAGWKEALRGL